MGTHLFYRDRRGGLHAVVCFSRGIPGGEIIPSAVEFFFLLTVYQLVETLTSQDFCLALWLSGRLSSNRQTGRHGRVIILSSYTWLRL